MTRALTVLALSFAFVFETANAFGLKGSGETRSADAVREIYKNMSTREDAIALELRAAVAELAPLGFSGKGKVLPGVRLGKVEIFGAELEKYLVPIEFKRLNGYRLEILNLLAVVEIDSTDATPKVVTILGLSKMDQFMSAPQS